MQFRGGVLLALLVVAGLLAINIFPAASATIFFYDLVVTPDPADIGETVTATATTNDPSITDVRFRWKNPDGAVVRNFNDGSAPYTDSRTADQIGDWEIRVWFKDESGAEILKVSTFKVSFLVVPEFPAGSILAVGAIFGGAILYSKIGGFKPKQLGSY